MFGKLFLLFTVLPAVELYLLIQIGKVMGGAWTVALVVLMGVLGAWLAKREGLHIVQQVLEDARRGIPPADRIVEGVLVVVGSILLITPGVITDAIGFLFLVPITRRALVPVARAWFGKNFVVEGLTVGPLQPGPAAREEQARQAARFDHPVS
jgi:UPF0716 protein FxsA